MKLTGRPLPGEYADYAQSDIDAVSGNDAIAALEQLRSETVALFTQFGETGADFSYGPGKWTVRQVLGHLADDERIFAYRALCIARGDLRALPGFDENTYAEFARFERQSLSALLANYDAVRTSFITLLHSFDDEAWLRVGTVNGYAASPRGLAFHIAGHELHHHRILRERYLPLLPSSAP
ncbi:MAG: DinB family protein [Gemmatimonadaceae bacterium]